MNAPSRTEPALWLERHGDALYAFALARVRDPAASEDLVQETLLAAFAARERFRGDAAERTWLTGILRHKVLDHLRRRVREVPLPQDRDAVADIEDACFDARGHWQVEVRDWARPERAHELAELRRALNECIGALPERLGTLFVLREVEGMDTGTLLEVLGISSANNLWVMLSRARMRLRACLEDRAFTPRR